jgi:hypothetical protein
MTKKNVEIIITSILILVFALLFMRSFNLIKKLPKTKQAPVQASSAPSAVKPPQEIAKTETHKDTVPNVLYPNLLEDEKLNWKRCPYSGMSYSEIEGPIMVDTSVVALEVGGIIWDAESPRALINEEVVEKGDKIGQYTVKEIRQESVILNDGVKDLELKLQWQK